MTSVRSEATRMEGQREPCRSEVTKIRDILVTASPAWVDDLTLDPLIKSCPEPRTQDTQADLSLGEARSPD